MDRTRTLRGGRVSERADQAARDRQTASLAGLAAVLLVVVLATYLWQALRVEATLEDCLIIGRHDCDALLNGRAGPLAR